MKQGGGREEGRREGGRREDRGGRKGGREGERDRGLLNIDLHFIMKSLCGIGTCYTFKGRREVREGGGIWGRREGGKTEEGGEREVGEGRGRRGYLLLVVECPAMPGQSLQNRSWGDHTHPVLREACK